MAPPRMKNLQQPGPQLPPHFLKELGVPESQGKQGRDKRHSLSRKDQRKADRRQKRDHQITASQTYAERANPKQYAKISSLGRATKVATSPAVTVKKPESWPTSKQRIPDLEEDSEDNIDLEEDDDDDDEEDISSYEVSDEEEAPPISSKPDLPKHVKERLAEDDAEIAALERKLGLKGRKSLPKSFQEDGLTELLGELGEFDGDDNEEASQRKKRKAEVDDWLSQKRRKAIAEQALEHCQKTDFEGSDDEFEGSDSDENADSDDVGLDDALDLGSGGDDEDDMSDVSYHSGEDGDSEELGADHVPAEKVQRVRENPYVAPTVARDIVKYVTPSLRQESGSDAELTARIRRQTQGLVNRITETSMLSILGDIEKLYREHPRQHVSSTLVDLLLIQVCDPANLPDTLLILTSGFATAACKVVGMDFGAQLIQEVVERFDRFYEEAAALAATGRPDVPKQTSNLITFLSKLYSFQAIGPNLLFDYIRMLLGNLSELNAELLLRIIRMCGSSLRQDDPMALKDIISLIRPAVSRIGEQSISVRTKFMIETINDLKNNKMKAGVGASAVVSEHTTRMKKILGSLNSRKLKSTEPLRMGLKDIQQSDKKGKWWLVGASWAGPHAGGQPEKTEQSHDNDDDDDDDESLLLSDAEQGPDLAELAREQMMNTDVRRSIFVAILSATDYEDAYLRILKLRLNKERQREVPNVIMQCSGAEQQYNPYYTLVAKKLCSDRKVRWSFQDSLWRLFRRLGESIFGDDAEDVDENEAADTRRLVNIAKMFGSLVASGALGLPVLKCLNLPYLQSNTRAFVEIMLIATLLECQTSETPRDAIAAAFKTAETAPPLARGLQWFMKKVIRKSDLAGSKENAEHVKEACKIAESVLEAVLSSTQDQLE
ncbi:hypothetical protein B0T26DRAFT_678107 [Lasiosphaeria miniovina]|uniref:MI domain-containing protein n=1 Tax=Lasiosphaeria miniovina TaxID=1954250 RepID=A0AA40DW25_9PEZI|nr:uncharacterized protein B0T26DRAFT_678107 [Lasiosphaeria miniovina]KAK0713823.1 hypothetical protein B0T26DRAFT_678107 [Lasiosphaeria miniovina]